MARPSFDPRVDSDASRHSAATFWQGRRVTVMGLGRHGGGVAAARYLALRLARVTISDTADRETLAESLSALDDVRLARPSAITVKLGGHDPADFRTAEYVVVNPAVPAEHPLLQVARDAGATLTSEIELFLRRCPAKVIGVSGSNGKSTTCTMLAAMLAAAGRRTWLGGNIGRSLLGELDVIEPDDWVVLELSSFQLAHLSAVAPWFAITIVTNCAANHLDWHGDFDSYRRAKQRLLRCQAADGVAVLGACDEVASWTSLAAGRTRRGWPLERIPTLAVPGDHNRHNAACAAAAAEAAGVCDDAIREALATFTRLDHRLQLVAEVADRRIYNDSKSTTPAATMAALAAVDGPIWLLAGGQAKGANFDELAAAITKQAVGAAFFGAARETLQKCVRANDADFPVFSTEQLDDALAWCWRQTRDGHAVLLSPACASHDQFRDYADRGEQFCQMAREMANETRKFQAATS